MGWHVLRVHCLFCALLSGLSQEDVCPVRGLVRRKEERPEPGLILVSHPFHQLERLATATGRCSRSFQLLFMYLFPIYGAFIMFQALWILSDYDFPRIFSGVKPICSLTELNFCPEPLKLSEAEHLILSLIAKCNHFSDFYFPHWFQLKPRQILDFLPPSLLVEKMPTPRCVQISLCHVERSGQLFLFSLIFIYMAVRSLSHGTQDLWSSLQHAGSFRCGRWTLSCGMWDLVPGSEIELRLPALGVQSLSHWTTREVPSQVFTFICSCSLLIPTEMEPPAHCQPPCWLTSGMGSTSCSQHVLHYGAGTQARGNLAEPLSHPLPPLLLNSKSHLGARNCDTPGTLERQSLSCTCLARHPPHHVWSLQLVHYNATVALGTSPRSVSSPLAFLLSFFLFFFFFCSAWAFSSCST